MRGPVFLPQDHQIDAGPLQLARQFRPVRLGMSPRPCLHAGMREQATLQFGLRHLRRQRPRQAHRRSPLQIVPDRRPRGPTPPPYLPRAPPAMGEPQHVPQLSHGQFPFRRHPVLLVDFDKAETPEWLTCKSVGRRTANRPRWPASSRNPGRYQIGSPDWIASESAPRAKGKVSVSSSRLAVDIRISFLEYH